MAGDNPFDVTPNTGSRGGAASRTHALTNPGSGFTTFLDQIEGKSDARQAELLGATPGLQRQQTIEPRYQDWMQVPNVVPGVPAPDERGIISRAIDFLMRPGYAGAGIVTGFLGLDRYADDIDQLGNQATQSRASTAFSRARQGITGQTQYRFADFTPIARQKSEGIEVPFYANVANIAGGFVLDTAFDPLTYVSFGGNLYGRRLGAKYIAGRVQMIADDVIGSPGFDPYRFLQQTYDSGRASAITPAAIASKFDALRRQALNANVISKPADRSVLLNLDLKPNQSMDEILDLLNRGSTEEINFAREIARQWFPDAAAMQFWTGGARGLRKWLIRTMGMEDGMEFYRALPSDIKGGIRIRIPFVRDESLPVALRIMPGGGGELSEKLAKRGLPQMEKFLDMTEAGRDVARRFFFQTPGIRRIFSQGKFSDVAYDAIISATGKRVTDGRTAFVTYGDLERSNWRVIAENNIFNTRQAAMRMAANESYAKNVEGLKLEEQRKVSRQIFLYLSDRESLANDANRFDSLSDVQKRAIEPALISESLLDTYGVEIQELGINETILKNFAMRMKTKREQARRALEEDSFTPSGGGKAGTLKTFRDSHVFEWKYDMNEGAKVARWSIAPDIRQIVDDEWENPYVSDFITALFQYSDDISNTLDSFRLAKIFSEAGIFTKKQTSDLATYNRSLIERDINELIGQGDEPGSLIRIRERILREFFNDAPAGQVGYNVRLGPESKSIYGLKGENLTPARARAFGREWDEAGIGDVVKREDFDNYSPRPPNEKITDKRVAEYYSNGADLSTIARLKDGTYELISEDGRVLSRHPTFQAAVEESRDIHMLLRDGKYNNYIIDKMLEIMNKIDELLYLNIGQVEGPVGLRAYRELALAPENVALDMRYGLYRYVNELPPEEARRAMHAINTRSYELVKYFGKDQPALKFDAFGNVVTEQQPRMLMNKKVKEDFAKFLREESWADLKNRIYLPDGTVDPKMQRVVQQRVLTRLDEVVAPRVVMDAFTRMVEVVSNPNGLEKTVYQPFYTALRSSMTLWRGFGFVGRNLLGGGYNASLYGVGVRHHTDAGKVLLARSRTRRQILDKYGEEVYQKPELGREMVETFKKNLEELFPDSGTYLNDVSDADAVFEIWSLGYNADLLGGSRSGRVVGDLLLNAPFKAERFGPFDVRRTFDKRTQLSRFIDIEAATGAPASLRDTSQDVYSKAMQYIATDNPWVGRIMGPLASTSEDQLRLASFLKGVQDFGLEPPESGIRGFAASTLVKITQFDYTDLTPFELRVFKNLMPFWVWTRNNVPLQVRSAIHNPGKIARYGRGLEAFQSFFQEDPQSPMPTYADNQFSVYIDPSYWDGAPQILKPILPKGTVAFSPFPWLDPLVDLNRWLKLPRRSSKNPVNWPELANNVNPIINAFAESLGKMSAGRDYSGSDYRDAPNWMIWTGLARRDASDPSKWVASQNIRNAISNLIPQVSLLERYFPVVFGDQRQSDRWLTTMVSAITGLTVATIDDLQVAGQATRDIEQTKWYTDRKWGPSASFRMDMIRRLLDEGAPVQFIEALDISNLPANEIDVQKAVQAYKIWDAFNQSYIAMTQGMEDPDQRRAVYDELIRPYQQYLDNDERSLVNSITGIWGSLDGFRGDFAEGIRAGAWQPPSNAEIRAVDVSRSEIDRLFAQYKDEDLSQEKREEAYLKLMDIHDQISLNRSIGRFTIFGERVRGWKPDDD